MFCVSKNLDCMNYRVLSSSPLFTSVGIQRWLVVTLVLIFTLPLAPHSHCYRDGKLSWILTLPCLFLEPPFPSSPFTFLLKLICKYRLPLLLFFLLLLYCVLFLLRRRAGLGVTGLQSLQPQVCKYNYFKSWGQRGKKKTVF